MANLTFLWVAAQVAKPGIAAVSKTAGRKAAQVQILPWALALVAAKGDILSLEEIIGILGDASLSSAAQQGPGVGIVIAGAAVAILGALISVVAFFSLAALQTTLTNYQSLVRTYDTMVALGNILLAVGLGVGFLGTIRAIRLRS